MQSRVIAGWVCLHALGGVSALAQAVPDTLGRVGGVVFDSVAMRPAAGALVQLLQVVAREGTSGRGYSATADARGRFEVGGLPVGRYLMGFYFVGIDTLNIELSPVVVDIRAGERTRADLAVPSPRRIVATICRDSQADSAGAIVGFLRDARNTLPLDSGTVTAAWNEISIGAGGVRFVPMKADARVVPEGFVLCGVPIASEVSLAGASGSDTSGAILVRIPDHGLLRKDVSIGGTVNVRGTVVTDAGTPAANAEVLMAGRERAAVTDSAGLFRVYAARAGTQTLEARALGFLPERRAVELRAGRDTSLEIQLTSLKKLMDTIHVVAERVYWADRGGFRARQRRGFGYFFDDQAVRRRRPFDIYDLLRTIPGVRVTRSGIDEGVLMRDGMGNCTPSLHIDGMRMPRSLVSDLRFLVPVEHIAGLEVYNRSGTTPAQFSDFNSCGAIVVWTQSPPKRRKR